MTRVTCPECGTKNNVNPKKRTHKPKHCTSCKTVILKPRANVKLIEERKMFNKAVKFIKATPNRKYQVTAIHGKDMWPFRMKDLPSRLPQKEPFRI